MGSCHFQPLIYGITKMGDILILRKEKDSQKTVMIRILIPVWGDILIEDRSGEIFLLFCKMFP